MTFDKHYPKRKDRRKPYRGSKSIDAACRPGGSCPYCQAARKAKRERGPKKGDWEGNDDQ